MPCTAIFYKIVRTPDGKKKTVNIDTVALSLNSPMFQIFAEDRDTWGMVCSDLSEIQVRYFDSYAAYRQERLQAAFLNMVLIGMNCASGSYWRPHHGECADSMQQQISESLAAAVKAGLVDKKFVDVYTKYLCGDYHFTSYRC